VGCVLNELDLVRRCQRGDEAAFEALYQAYAERALRTAFLITDRRTLAEDAVQETFIQVWRSIRDLRDPRAFRGWFYRILIHRVRRLGKRDGREPDLPLEAVADHRDTQTTGPEEQAERNEAFHRVRVVITRLPEAQRLTLVLRYYSGLTESEIAEALRIPIGTVKSRLHTARARLRDQLSRHEAQIKLAGLRGRREARG
jgi:RNA polymerase sigma factor (sigma-70 family)